MSDQIILHAKTEARLDNFIASPSHSLILAGPAGSGKTALALWLVGHFRNQQLDKLINQPDLKLIAPDGKSISIDEVRGLSQFLKLKTTGKADLRRFVVVEQAENLTREAQNAFLKLFEEPPDDTLIILTVSSPKALLPTVLSRAQLINVALPTKAQLEKNFQAADFEKLYSLSGGRPGLLSALFSEEGHLLITAVEDAKRLLSLSKFEQFGQIEELARRKDNNLILEALQLIADSGLTQAANQQNSKLLGRWQGILKATYDTKIALQKGAQAKLALTNLLLNL